jgi:hypothetical protein
MRKALTSGLTIALLFTSLLGAQTPGPLIDPTAITYLGAFKVPDTDDGTYGTFNYSDAAIAYYPNGDSTGAADGFPGSVFINSHPYASKVAELTIPAPSTSRTLSSLPVAQILQPFASVKNAAGFIMGMTYIASENRFYYSSSDDYLDGGCMAINLASPAMPPALGSFGPNLNSPATQGAWYLSVNGTVLHPYQTSRYLMEVPKSAADASFGGRTLMSGRHRGWCSTNGPQLYSWATVGASPPAAKTAIPAKTVLQYGTDAQSVSGFSPTNNYQGAVWLTSGSQSAVVISGVMEYDTARAYYGYDNWKVSTQCDGIVPFPCTGTRGWRAADPRPAFLLFNPADLAAVAAGTKQSSQVQPYARIDLKPYMLKAYPATMNVNSSDGETIVSTFDRARGLIYVTETRVDGLKPVVHVFRVGTGSGTTPPPPTTTPPPTAPANLRIMG